MSSLGSSLNNQYALRNSNPDLNNMDFQKRKSNSYRIKTLMGDGGKYKPSLYKVQFGESNPNLIDNLRFGNNMIKTTRYNLITLVPKNLFFQFTRASNIYFLIVSILTCLPFSPKEPSSMIGTFVFVLFFTMLKDAIEDFGRYQQDKKANNKPVIVFTNGNWSEEKCFQLKPGDLVKLKEGEECSCDILILKSSNSGGYIFLDTKNLDGETNLKEKSALEELKEYNMDNNDLKNVIGNIETTDSNANLNEWEGLMKFNSKSEIYCCLKNMILKGSVIKNTHYVIGVVIYAGHYTKIMKNSKNSVHKTSKIIKTMNKIMYSLFAFTVSVCVIFSVCNVKFVDKYANSYTYIFYLYDSSKAKNRLGVRLILNFFTFLVAYAQIIPISLYVVMEMIKLFQGLLINYDYEIYDLFLDKPATCRESGLIEELGQIDFIFSDKTGTLTQNIMEFKRCFVNGKIYGVNHEKNECTDAKHTINGDYKAFYKLANKPYNEDEKEDKEKLNLFFILLSTCHEVFPEKDDKQIKYQGSSPDDLALVKGAQQLGYEFQEKNFNMIKVHNEIYNQDFFFELLCTIPFDSERKRMSVILKNQKDNKVYIFTKGSDGIMLQGVPPKLPIINEFTYETEEEQVDQILLKFGKEGLRILVMGYRELESNIIENWLEKYNEARKKNPMILPDLYNEIEKDLIFCGITAIEDKLQEDVPDTIHELMTCGIRIWVLTGDKQDTAEQIGRQCHLIEEEMRLFNLSTPDGNKADLYEKLSALVEQFDLEQFLEETKIDLDQIMDTLCEEGTLEEQIGSISLIIDGVTLNNILEDKHLRKMFFLLGVISKSVICCRVSPKQKSDVVRLAKNSGEFVTLSIGDGANDVPMILEASIGVGIQGREGTQAARTADYSIGQFRFLEKLILYYGRNGYIKISKYICYYFYKNIILVVTELLFVFFNGYSGQIFFPDWYGTMFNAIFTSWPCLFVFAYEKEHDILTCKKFPILYRAGPKNVFFNLKIFWVYVIYGLIHSVLCFCLPAYSLNGIVDEKGNNLNNWKIATVSFTLVIHVVSMKLLIISEFWNIFSIGFTILSVIIYYIIIIFLCVPAVGRVFQPEIVGIFWDIIKNLNCVIIIICGPFLILLPDIICKQIFFIFFPNPNEYLKKYYRNNDFRKIITNENISTNRKGKIQVKRVSKIYTMGVISEASKTNKRTSVIQSNIKLPSSKLDNENNNTRNPLKTIEEISNGTKNDNFLDKLNKKTYYNSKGNMKNDFTSSAFNVYSDKIYRNFMMSENTEVIPENPNEVKGSNVKQDNFQTIKDNGSSHLNSSKNSNNSNEDPQNDYNTKTSKRQLKN